MSWKRTSDTGHAPFLPRLLLLASCFLGGILLGQVVLGRVPDETGVELSRYLTDYMRLEQTGSWSAQALLSALVLYLRYPLLAFILGFASIGVVLLPCAALSFGFFLSFSVCCFTAAFGTDGMLLALAMFGVRCAVTLPCFLLLAVPSLETSAALVRATFGSRPAMPLYGSACWKRLCVVLLVLAAGICVESLFSPRFLGFALERITI